MLPLDALRTLLSQIPPPAPSIFYTTPDELAHHHHRAKTGAIYGETDDFSYNIVKDPLHISEFHATVMHLLGFDHLRLTYKHQGLDGRLTGVEMVKPVKALMG